MTYTAKTLYSYFGRHFFIGLGIVLALLALLMLTVEVIEHLRRASGREIPFSVILSLSVIKMPTTMQKLWPFVFLFGGMLSFSRLANSSELVVARAAGMSVWQILTPLIGIAALSGLFITTIYAPVAASLMSRYNLENQAYFGGNVSLISRASAHGLWMRESTPDGHVVIYAQRVGESGTFMEGITFLIHGKENRFTTRIDAEIAILDDGQWAMRNVVLTRPDKLPETHKNFALNTTLSLNRIVNSLTPPESISFWKLPDFIELLENSGFTSLKHQMYWHSLLAQPLLLSAMSLLAAMFCIRMTHRRTGTGWMFLAAAGAGFFIFFVTDLVGAFGSAGKIPVVLAAWTPAGVTSMMAAATMFHLEDG